MGGPALVELSLSREEVPGVVVAGRCHIGEHRWSIRWRKDGPYKLFGEDVVVSLLRAVAVDAALHLARLQHLAVWSVLRPEPVVRSRVEAFHLVHDRNRAEHLVRHVVLLHQDRARVHGRAGIQSTQRLFVHVGREQRAMRRAPLVEFALPREEVPCVVVAGRSYIRVHSPGIGTGRCGFCFRGTGIHCTGCYSEDKHGRKNQGRQSLHNPYLL